MNNVKIGLITKLPLDTNANITAEQRHLMEALNQMSIASERGSTREVRTNAARAVEFYSHQLSIL